MAAIYPPQLVDAICNGINEQIKADKLDQNIIARIEAQKAKENATKVMRMPGLQSIGQSWQQFIHRN